MENVRELVVFVDDNSVPPHIKKDVLTSKYDVVTASCSETLFSLLETNKSVLVILDIDMPGIDGFQTIKTLKSKHNTKDIPVICLVKEIEESGKIEALKFDSIDYIIKPVQNYELLKRIEMSLLLSFHKNLQDSFLKTIAELICGRGETKGNNFERTQAELKIFVEEMEKSGIYSDEIKKMNKGQLLQACLLHDIGKISIDDTILNKRGRLTPEEFSEIKKHTIFGEKIVNKIEERAGESDFLNYAKVFAAAHHEKWDGTGYPRGLKGQEIPLVGRIMAIIHVYDALTQERPYKETAFTHEEVVNIIVDASGTQFEPDLVEVFKKAADKFRANSQLLSA